MGTRLFFVNPRLGKAKLATGQMCLDQQASNALTKAVRTQQEGPMQTLNALTTTPDGSLLAVDRNGGWILRVTSEKTERWLNLYDLAGVNLREALADFPESRHMPYISIEGIAVEPDGTLWMLDDPAMPEGFRASCLLRVSAAVITRPAR
jgi:glucose/arabinose dehydrogenase